MPRTQWERGLSAAIAGSGRFCKTRIMRRWLIVLLLLLSCHESTGRTPSRTPRAAAVVTIPKSNTADLDKPEVPIELRPSLSPIAWHQGAASRGVCAIDRQHRLRCWTLEDDCSLGKPLPSGVSSAEVRAVSSGYRHTCALLKKGEVRCWGENSDAQLGTRDETEDETVPLSRAATNVSGGFDHSCAALSGGALQCWGDNSTGQLGIPAIPYGEEKRFREADPRRTIRVSEFVDVAAGGGHTCGLLTNGKVRCWGDDREHKLGHGLPLDEALSTSVSLAGPAKSIYAGTWTNCAILTDGKVQCWGSNEYGQLCDGGADRPVATTIPLPLAARSLTISESRVCGVLVDGSYTCWGGRCQSTSCDLNPKPALPGPCEPTIKRVSTKVSALVLGDAGLCFLDVNGSVTCECH